MLTPSKITAWLDCVAYLDLVRQVEGGTLELAGGGAGSFARLLMDKGLEHELACLAHYEAQGLRVRRVPERDARETFAAWAARVGAALHDDDWDVLYQLPLVHDGIRGVADFLLRTTDGDGQVSIEPVDAKLARQEAKPGHVLQLAFYAEALEAATGTAPRHLHLWLGSGRTETLHLSDVAAYWRRLRGQLRRVLDAPAAEAPAPEPCTHCAFCEFLPVCEDRWRQEDALHHVAGLRVHERVLLQESGVPTLAALAEQTEPVHGLAGQRQVRLVTQAALQRQAREQGGDLAPPFLLVRAGEDRVWGHGMSLLPARDGGDVFLDFEGHPFWRADQGLFFLMGLIERSASGEWEYRTWWAHDVEQEGRATAELIAHLAERRRVYPGMHVYHYNHTERSSLQRLASEHGVGEAVLTELVETGAFVDLYEVARNAVQVGTESYGLKALERLTGFQRGHNIDAGAGAVVSYEQWAATQEPSHLAAIAAYNEDDVRATLAVRDWLVAQRPAGLPWRAAHLNPEEPFPELDERVARLHAFPVDSVEHLLGDLLGYWKRERSATITPVVSACNGDASAVAEDPRLVGPLTCVGEVERLGLTGKPITPGMLFRFPVQDVSELEKSVLFPVPDGPPGFATVTRLDPEVGELELGWSTALAGGDVLPRVLGPNTWVAARPKPDALLALADAMLDPAVEPDPVAMALLRRDLPRFLPGHAPTAGGFTDDVDDMLRWTTGMDGTCVAVQGPPGTGKTYRGARQVHALVKAGKRVGITAFSHAAIDNLLRAVVELFEERGDAALLNAVRRNGTKGAVPGVAYASGNSAAAKPGVNLVAGSTWLFAGDDLAGAPVDVLVVDEAGQLSLADTLAACRSARNLLLLGDPLQLPQVSVATHPGGSGASALEHLLGTDATLPADQGVFITETRRMHPDVCRFISDNVYDGRLTSHPSCAKQATELGTGLRWLRAEHDGCSTSSSAEVELVHSQVRRRLGTAWTDQHGAQRPLTVEDVLVVAPYNDHVALLRERFDGDPFTQGLSVGSVDRFQGREAAVVFFTMATSSAEHMPRSSGFLFSRNRLNVAVSRARCLAYLVCTEELLDTRARSVEEMRLLSTLCAFVESVPLAVPRQQQAPAPAVFR